MQNLCDDHCGYDHHGKKKTERKWDKTMSSMKETSLRMVTSQLAECPANLLMRSRNHRDKQSEVLQLFGSIFQIQDQNENPKCLPFTVCDAHKVLHEDIKYSETNITYKNINYL